MNEAVARHRNVDGDRAAFGLDAPFRSFVGNDAIVTIGRDLAVGDPATAESVGFLHAPAILQDIADYRALLRDWHAMLAIGGRLAIAVPHAHLADRALALPLPGQPTRKRLYTPASLLAEIEEALEPNAYRIRFLCDDDTGCDLEAETPNGAGSVLLVLERTAPPDWTPSTGAAPEGPPPSFAFEPARTRREVAVLAPRRRIILLKLDHLGDFIMGIPALEKARAAFADADVTLVVGSWNADMARGLGLFETVVAFDAFPRNSTEERVNLAARVPEFERLFPTEYDLAIDLRCDPDTRFFLRHLRAAIRAGIGTRAQFDFLNIFLPIDGSRHGYETAAVNRIEPGAFAAAAQCTRSEFRIAYDPAKAERAASGYLLWGPYARLRPGEYLYEPLIDIAENEGALMFDVAQEMVQVTQAVGTGGSVPKLRFHVREPHERTEFRILSIAGQPVPGFSFHGGRLFRRGASSVLHQSEYLSLLIELVTMRTDRFGLLREDSVAS